MRAAVGQPRHRGRVQQHLAHGVVVAVRVVEERQHEQLLRVVLQHEVVEHAERVDALGRGARHHRVIARSARSRAGRRAGRCGRAMPRMRSAIPSNMAPGVGGRSSSARIAGAHVGTGAAPPRAPREAAPPAAGGTWAAGRTRAGSGTRAACRTAGAATWGTSGAPLSVARSDSSIELAPQVGGGVDLHERVRHRHADLGGQPAHPVDLLPRRDDVLARRAQRRELEHRAAAGGHRPAEAEQLVLGRERAGHRLAVHRAVAERARRGEPERAGLDRLAHEPAPSPRCHRGWRARSSRPARPSRRRAPRRARSACRRRRRARGGRARRGTAGTSPSSSPCPP